MKKSGTGKVGAISEAQRAQNCKTGERTFGLFETESTVGSNYWLPWVIWPNYRFQCSRPLFVMSSHTVKF